jgi:hypothetical protein
VVLRKLYKIKISNSEIIYVECMDKDLEMKDDKRKNVIKEIRDESIQIR